MPEKHKPRPPHRWRGFWIFFVVLLALNWLSVLIVEPGGQPRVTVPFSPYFIQQVQPGHVKSINSTVDTIQGTFTHRLRYPASDRSATPTTLFQTQVPTFWSSSQLTALLRGHNVQVNAQQPSTGTSLLAEILLGFGPTLLFVGLFYFLMRRAAAVEAGDWARLGDVRALAGPAGRSREDPDHVQRRGRDRRGQEAS